MSYVQGTTVRLQADFADPITDAAVNPAEVVLTVHPPTGAPFQRTLTADEVQVDSAREGRFFYLLDTSSEAGTWRYQFEDPAVNVSVVQRESLTVTARLDA